MKSDNNGEQLPRIVPPGEFLCGSGDNVAGSTIKNEKKYLTDEERARLKENHDPVNVRLLDTV